MANAGAQHLANSNHNLNNDTKDSNTTPGTSTSATKQTTNMNSSTVTSGGAAGSAISSGTSQNATSSGAGGAAGGDAAAAGNNDTDLESFFRDWRHFECQTWHLEPTVRILYWAGKSIEPYGIDYILNKLGFSHARTTIPKWLQRGFMDPLDKVQALMMMQLLNMIRENKQEQNVKNNKNSN